MRAKRSELESKASFRSHMGLSNNAESQKIIDYLMFLIDHITNIRVELASPAVTLFDGLFLIKFGRYELEILTRFGYRFWIYSFNFFLSKFWDVFFLIIAFLVKPDLCNFLRVTQELMNIFETLYFYYERTSQHLSESLKFSFE